MAFMMVFLRIPHNAREGYDTLLSYICEKRGLR